MDGQDTGTEYDGTWSMSFDDAEDMDARAEVYAGYAPGPASPDERLRLSDMGKLARLTRRRIVGVARADDRPSFLKILTEHLRAPLDRLEVVEETWPNYELVNVQVGLNAWLDVEERTHQLVGVTNFRHQEFGLTDLLQTDRYGHGPTPGNVSWSSLASGPDGAVTIDLG